MQHSLPGYFSQRTPRSSGAASVAHCVRCEKSTPGQNKISCHTLSPFSIFRIFAILLLLNTNLHAQTDSLRLDNVKQEIINTPKDSSLSLQRSLNTKVPDLNVRTNYYLSPEQKRKRTWLVAGANVLGYGGTMIALYNTWYKDYPQTGFHSFNDFPEWKQVDKLGHLYSAYIESRVSMEMWGWTGMERKKRIWIGGMSGAVYQTVIEVLDGFSAGWGWSWADFGANILGSGSLVAQELAWNDQRIKLKFSFHKKVYNDPSLNQRSDKLFGQSIAERLLKDYNGQTYWASSSVKSFFPGTGWPAWLTIAIGYGAEGLFGGTENIGKDASGNVIFNRPDIKRYRQWYLAPDIDLTKINTNKKALKFLFTLLSAFKFPSPALEFSNGKWKIHAVSF